MKSEKSRNYEIPRINSLLYKQNMEASSYIKQTLTNRTDTIGQNTTMTSIRNECKTIYKKPEKMIEKSIINSKIQIKQNFNDNITFSKLIKNTSRRDEVAFSMNRTNSYKKMFSEYYNKKSLEESGLPRRFMIKINKNFGKPSNELKKFNDRVLTTSRSHSYKTPDTKKRIFDTQRSTSFEVKNHRSFKYPQGQSRVGDILSYKNGPKFRQEKLPNSINKNDFDILKKVKKYDWEK